jgi:hypothetical protein
MQMHNPPHPGEFIEGMYLQPCALSIRQVAERVVGAVPKVGLPCRTSTTSGKPVSESIFQG